MTYSNLSTIGATYVLEVEGENGPEYWKGGMDFTTDIEQAQVYGTGNALKFIKYLANRAISARAVAVPSQYQLMRWVGTGWVVLNTHNEEATVHRVRLVNGEDHWFFSQTDERSLIIRMKSGDEDHYQVDIKGDQIVKVVAVAAGEVMEDFTAFHIPDDSNLKYLFEFEDTPVEELEVA